VEFVPSQYDPAVLTAGQVDGIFCFYNDLPVALATQGVEGYSMPGRRTGLAALRGRPEGGGRPHRPALPGRRLDLKTQQRQAEVQVDIRYSDLTKQSGFAWYKGW
jgi:hypothetical protein